MTTETTLKKIERAHQMYRESKHGDALELYTEALGLAKNKAQKIALHSNRAACYLKLHDFNKAAQECTSVLALDQQHTGALMLRAQTLVTLKDYQSALFDVNRLMELNPESDVYHNLQARLRTQLVVINEMSPAGKCSSRVQSRLFILFSFVDIYLHAGLPFTCFLLLQYLNPRMNHRIMMRMPTRLGRTPLRVILLNLLLSRLEVPRLLLTHIHKGGKQFQNLKDTLVWTTRDGTMWKTIQAKTKKMKEKISSLNIDSVSELSGYDLSSECSKSSFLQQVVRVNNGEFPT